MQPAELTDFEKAKQQLENYEKIYGIVEYVSELNEHMTTLERRIQTNNQTIPQNMWRTCQNNSFENLWPEIETSLQAYYDLIDDCKEFPIWKRKLEEDLGGVVSFMAIQMEEVANDELNSNSAIFKRFQDDKQIYFK